MSESPVRTSDVRLRAAFAGGAVFIAALTFAQAAGDPPGQPGKTRVLLPDAAQRPQTWRYTFDRPAEGWFKPDFDDSSWKEGKAGFGTGGTPGAVIGTTWDTKDIWLRTAFDYDGSDFKNASVRIHHDEDATVYLNARKVLTAEWFVTDYELIDAAAEIRKALRRGRNVLAVTCHQTSGGQYIDVGIVLDAESVSAAVPKLPPVKPLFDYYVRDPSICLVDGVYYLTGTTGHPTWWQTNEGIRVWKSADLVRWEPLGLVYGIEKDGEWNRKFVGGRRALWAPEIHHLKGTFWLTYCMNYRGCGLLKSTTLKAEGPYKDVKPAGPLTGEIDASLFGDDDGKVYFVHQNGLIARMNDDMTDLAEKPRLLKPSNGKEVGFEGAFLFKIGGRYHLSCASFERKGNYDCMIATSDNVYGPYGGRYLAVPHGGHNMFFKDKDGNWWSTIFGSDPRAPIHEHPGILRVRIDAEGRISPGSD